MATEIELERWFEKLEAEVHQQIDMLFKKLEYALTKPEKGYFNYAEAAAFVGCSKAHISRHAIGGMLPVSNIGTNDGPDYRISRGDLIAWMEKRKAGASAPPRRKKTVVVQQPVPFSIHRRISKRPCPVG